jgi:hypothetical protein
MIHIMHWGFSGPATKGYRIQIVCLPSTKPRRTQQFPLPNARRVSLPPLNSRSERSYSIFAGKEDDEGYENNPCQEGYGPMADWADDADYYDGFRWTCCEYDESPMAVRRTNISRWVHWAKALVYCDRTVSLNF